MMKRSEHGEEGEEALSLSHSPSYPMQTSLSHDHNLFPGESSSSSSRFCLRSPTDFSLFANGPCDGPSLFISPPYDGTMETMTKNDLSLSESLLHGLNIREEEQDKNLQGTLSVPSNSPQSLRGLQGHVYSMAKDQHECRSLQRILEDGTYLDAMVVIYDAVIPHVLELMINPFGNYLVQKLLDVCDEAQREEIIHIVTSEPAGLLGRIALDAHGTRVVQRLVESIKTKEHILRVTSALRHEFLNLARDVNGNHVIERCLQCLTTQDNEFIFEDATRFCIDIATHKRGSYILQKCFAYSTGQQRENLITEISRNSLFLAQDPYGNYAVQFVIEMNDFQATAMVLARLKGYYVELSMQKHSSHVVQKCLKHCQECRPQIVNELISVPRFELLVQDPFANFVIQVALSVTEGSSLHEMLVEVVRPHSNLRKSPYCKGIFSSNPKKN